MSEYGLTLYNTEGYKQIDTSILAYKTLILKSTHFLAVAAKTYDYPRPMNGYYKSQHPVLNNIDARNLIMVRPASTNMCPITIGFANQPTAGTGGIDLMVRSSAAGNIEIRQYVATGDTDYAALIAALPAGTRYGIQARNANDEIVFDSDITMPRILGVVTAEQDWSTSGNQQAIAGVGYTGPTPFVSVNASAVSITYPDTLTTEAATDVFVEINAAYFTTAFAGYKSDCVSNSGGAQHWASFDGTFLVMKE